MKKLLIIYPHFPPSNLAGVHRPRLFAQHLPSFGWIPTVLTVHEDFYEERLDPDLLRLLPDNLRIEKVNALPLTKPRIIGDLGLRAFFSLYKKAREMIRSEGFDFLLIPIPSFYTALLGRWLCSSTGIKYGIDYIDPWVHRFPGTDRLFSRHWWSTQIANLLEPIAVKKAALITGVAKGYYESVLERSPRLKKTAFTGAMPYGVEKGDMEKLYKTGKKPYLFQSGSKIRLVYAGAMLPKAFAPLEEIMAEIAKNRKEFADIEFYFIGTGKTADNTNGYNIKPLAEKYKLWQSVIIEHPARIPYLDVLAHLSAANGIFVLGSTEPHYTPSKIYQAIIVGKPIFAVLHRESTAVDMIRKALVGTVLDFNGPEDAVSIGRNFIDSFRMYRKYMRNFDPGAINQEVVAQYSARESTAKLAALLDLVMDKKSESK